MTGKSIKSIRFDDDLIKRIEERGKKENRKFSNMVVSLIVKGLEND